MTAPVRLLHLEDDPKDAMLVLEMLEMEGLACEATRVDTRAEFVRCLERGGFDLILADQTLPSFDGLSALKIARDTCPDVPFIFVSGTIGEAVAIEALTSGATDYVLKERLSRVVPSVRRALREAGERADRRRAETLLAGERRLLEMIARGVSLPGGLEALCRLVEELSPGALASILLLDPDGQHLRHGAAPSLPKVYTEAIDGAPIGPVAGSCGTAAYRKEPVTVTDIANDPLWSAYKDLALPHGLRACWSTPVLGSDGRVLGTFAIYARETRGPTPAEQSVIEQITHLASIAIERTRAEEERQAHLWFLERMDRVNRAIQGTSDLEQMTRDVLDATLALLDCDRAWLVFPCDPNALSHGVRMQRTRPEFPGLYDVGMDIPMDDGMADVFRIALEATGPVRFDPGSAHPMPPEMSKRLGSLSRLVMAIYPKGDQPWLFGVSQCSSARVWTEREEQLVEAIGRRLTDALTSLLMLRNLRQSERNLEQAQRIAHVGHWEGDLLTEHFMYSEETYRIFGLSPDGRGRTFQDIQALVHPADRARRVAVMENARQHGERYELEYRIVLPSGEIRFVRTEGDVRNDESGRPRFLFGIIQDITDRKRAEQRLIVQANVTRIVAEATTPQDATRRILRVVCEGLGWDVGTLWVPDETGGVLRCAEFCHAESLRFPRFEALTRESAFVPGTGVPGRVWASRAPLYVPDAGGDPSLPRAPVAALEGLHAAFAFPILLGGDVGAVMEFISREIRHPDEEQLGLMATIGSQMGQFIERKRAEDALRSSEASLAEGQRVSHTGSWRWNPRSGEVSASVEHFRIFGLDPSAEPRTHRDYRERVHPDDRATVKQILNDAVREQRAFDYECRIVRPDGVVTQLHVVGRPATDASGQLEFFGTIQDITERKRAQQRLVLQSTVTRVLAEAATLEEATRALLQAVCEILGWDLGALWRVDRSTNELHCVETWHRESFQAPHFVAASRGTTFARGVGFPGHVWASREPAFITDFADVAAFPRASVARREGLHTAVAFPILLAGDVVGTMEFFSRETVLRDDEMIHTMATIGSQIGQLIERKRAEDALRMSEASLAEGQRVSHTGSWRWNPRSGEVYASAEHFRLLGWAPPASGARTHSEYRECVHPDDRPMVEQIIDDAVRDGTTFAYECRVVRSDGVIKHLHNVGHPVRDASGQLEFFGTSQDITERKQAERRIATQYTVAQALAEAATVEEAAPKILRTLCECLEWDVGVLWRLDRTAELMRCVDIWRKESLDVSEFEAATRALKCKPGIGMAGRVWVARGPVHVPDFSKDPYVEPSPTSRTLPTSRATFALDAGLISRCGFPILLGDEVLGAISFYGREIREPDPELLNVMATIGSQIGQFIERKRAEDALRASEASLAEGQKISHTGSWRWDPRTGEVHASAEHLRIFGFDPSAGPRPHHQYRDRVHPDDRPMIERVLEGAVRDRLPFAYDYRIVLPEGVVTHVQAVGRPAVDASGQLEFVGTIQDITERKQAESRIAAQYTVGQALAEAATLEEAAPKILRAICECLEWDVGGLWRVDPTVEVMRCVDVWHHASLDVSEFEAATRALTFKPGIGMPGRVWAARGPVHVPDVSRDPYLQPGPNTPRAPAALRAGLHSGFGVPIRLGGEVLGAIEFYSREIREPDPELLNVMGTVGIQIGSFLERKRAEEALRRAQTEVAHVTRVATLGELTASIAHEINQPLGAVVNNASACVRWLAAQNLEEARRSATLVIADGHRAAQIISRVRALAANVPPQSDRLDLEATVQDVIAFARSEAHRHGVALDTDFAEGLSPILGDRVQLQQVVLNLVMNAIEAMSAGDWAPRAVQVSVERASPEGVVVAVRDSGPGFDPQHIGRLFDAFYTTKTKGLGLGLAISRRIIEAHGGRLWATANTPRGAVFQFTLPVAETPPS